MKNYRRIILLATTLFVVSTSQAQRLGIIGGLNYANMSISQFQSTSPETESDNKNILGYNIGITMDIPFSEKLSLQSSILYSTKGNKYEVSTSDNSFGYVNSFELSQNIKLSYIELPISLKLSLPVGKIKVFGACGPYIAWGISGSEKIERTFNLNGDITNNNFKDDISWGNSSSSFLKRLDYGIGYNLGVEINSFQIGASYSQGLANISSNKHSIPSIKNRVIRISVAFFIGKEKSKIQEE